MNKKYRKRKVLFSVLMCAVLLVGCSVSEANKSETTAQVMEKEESKAIPISFIGGKDVMPIAGYFGPYVHAYSADGNVFPEYITDEYFQLIADAGINLVVYSSTNYASLPNAVKKNLELGEKYGVGIFVTDNNVIGKAEKDEISAEEVAKEIINYSDYKALV